MSLHCIQTVVRICIILFCTLVTGTGLIGCSSSILYTRSGEKSDHYYVPSNWDYRKNYKVPEVKLKQIAESYIGVRYKSGGMSRKGFDCSGYVCIVFKQLNHAKLPRSTSSLKYIGNQVSLENAQIGDLVFFRGGFFNGINHVAIYMGNKTFIHASNSKGITYDTLDDTYYQNHFAMIRRIF